MMNKNYFFNSLLSVSLMSFLTCGAFLQADMATEGQGVIQTRPDGTKFVQDKEGNSIQIRLDGTKVLQRADGTSVELRPDGSKVIHEAGGAIIEIKPDGSKFIKKADGSTVEVKPGDIHDEHPVEK